MATIELTLEKECGLQPGTDLHLVKVDGKKLIVEVTAAKVPLEDIVKAFEAKEQSTPKRKMEDILADYPGGRLFKTAQEVDEYLKAERDSWDK